MQPLLTDLNATSEHTRTWHETKTFEVGSPSTIALTDSDRGRVHAHLVDLAISTQAVQQVNILHSK